MSIEKCNECGCPQTDNWRGMELHFEKCKLFKEKTVGLTRSKPLKAKQHFGDLIKEYKNELQIIKNDIKLLRDCVKNTRLDEVYECRL